VPSPSVIIAALRAARRVNDFPTAVRIFEGKYHHHHPPPQTLFLNLHSPCVYVFVGLTQFDDYVGIKAKVENKGQYDEYVEELRPIREELGLNLKEALYPEEES